MLKGKARWDGMPSQDERERERKQRLQRSHGRGRGEGVRSSSNDGWEEGRHTWSSNSWRGKERGTADRERSNERPKPKMSFMEEALNRSRDLAKAARNHIPVAVFDTPVEESWTGGGLGLAGPSRPSGSGWGGRTEMNKNKIGGSGVAIAPPPSLAAPRQRAEEEFQDHDWGSASSTTTTTVYPKSSYNANLEIPGFYPRDHPFNQDNIVNPLFNGSSKKLGRGGISRKERERMRDSARLPQRPGAAIPPPPLLTQPSHPPVVDEMGFEVERPLSSPEPSPTNSPSHVQPDSWDDGSNPVTFSKPAVTFSKPRVEKPVFNSKTFIGPTQGSWNSTKPSTTKATSGIGAKIMAKYGYRDGEGLGREKQGLTTALSFVRTSGARGVIVNKDEADGPPEAIKGTELCPLGGKGKKKAAANQPFPTLQKKETAAATLGGAKISEVSGNPVGELQELCTAKKWPLPSYEQLQEWGPCHERNFKLKVSINDGTATISEECSGTPKKLVKKLVAMQMIKRLKDI